MGCPNLVLSDCRIQEQLVDQSGYGLIRSAVKGHSAFIEPMACGALTHPQRLSRIHHGAKLDDVHWIESGKFVCSTNRAKAAKVLAASYDEALATRVLPVKT